MQVSDLIYSAESPQPVSGRLKIRPDLVASSDLHDANQWTIKDPVSRSYFRLSEHQWFLLQCFDGRSRSLEIRRKFHAQFAPRRISPEALLGFAARLHEQGLLVADAPGQGQVLLDRYRANERRQRLSGLLSVLSIRVPLCNPQKLLDFLMPCAKILFSGAAAALLLLFSTLAVMLLVGRTSVVLDRVPQLDDFLHRGNVLCLIAVFVAVKICHEFGHALACRRYGAECREIGVMFLAFMPCLYCDVSDAWTIRSKWQRAIVSAAGMYVELWIAALCAFLWYFSEPGFVNALFFNGMVVCTVVTVMFNANPLLRYDGYFILSDLVNISNLGTQASRALKAPLKRWLMPAVPVRDRARKGLVLYAVVAGIYRAFTVVLILWALYTFLKGKRMQPLGDVLVMSTTLALIVAPTWKTWHFLKHPSAKRLVRWGRVAGLGLAFVGVVLAVLLCPWPHTVKAPLLIEAAHAVQLYAPLSALVHAHAEYGQQVEEGAIIAVLTNDELMLEQSELDAEVSRLELSLQEMKSRIEQEPELASLLPPTEAALARARQQQRLGEEKLAKLTVRSPSSGQLLPPPVRDGDAAERDALRGWSGFALSAENEGCHVDAGDVLCLVQTDPEVEAVLLVQQGDMEFVQIGQPVRLYFDEMPERTWEGVVQEISREEVAELSRELSANRDVAVRPSRGGKPELAETSYFVRVGFDPQPAAVRHGSAGIAKIEVGDRTVGQMVWRSLQTTFRFRL
jgi:putative peptide zinc metalloprotease protein